MESTVIKSLQPTLIEEVKASATQQGACLLFWFITQNKYL